MMKNNKKPQSGIPLRLGEYAKIVAPRYQGMKKREKTKFLQEVSEDFTVHRRTVARALLRAQADRKEAKTGPRAKPGRKPLYDADELTWWLQTLWVGMGYPNTKLMPVMISEWLPLQAFSGEEEIPGDVKKKLSAMSGSTMERLLARYKRELSKSHFNATKGHPRGLKKYTIQIPQRPVDFKISSCGYMEGDTVAHCGDRLLGHHGWTLNMVCFHSAWTESRAFLGKEAESILKATVAMRSVLPFPMKGYHTDCGTEFLNEPLNTYLCDPKNYVTQTHGRAYRKNDQARVEQKNWTQVRCTFGYERVEEQKAVDCMNDIYANELRLLRNFFIPTMKQKSKVRVGSKYKRKFEKPQTPYVRVLEDASVADSIKEALREEKKSLNPFVLKKQLDQKLRFFEKLLQNQNKTSESKSNIANEDPREAA
jgi:hypothetical protein